MPHVRVGNSLGRLQGACFRQYYKVLAGLQLESNESIGGGSV